MSYRFGPSGLVVVRVRIEGPAGAMLALFALDTGAERSCVPPSIASAIGVAVSDRGAMWTASERVPVRDCVLTRFDALGLTRFQFPALVHALPAELPFGGLLGLDFLRDTRLTIDFRRQTIQVADTVRH